MRLRLALVMFLLPAAAAAQDARTILETMQERQLDRWEGVENYVVDQAMMGRRVLLYFERVEAKAPDGKVYPGFRMVPPDEIARRQQEGRGGVLTPADLRRMSDAAEMTGDVANSETERAMSEAGLPPGLLSASPDRFAMPSDMADFAAMAELVGTEDVHGREAWVIRAENVGRTQRTANGQEMTIHTATYWIDTKEHVPLRLKMEGTMTSEGETRAVTIERQDQDYRRVGSLYMPYRQVMRIAGVMDAAQQAEMQEAQAQLAEFERKMAEMPASQRQMVESMMGPQMEMMKKMASGGGIEVVTDVHQVRVNAGLPDEQTQAEVLFLAMPSVGNAGDAARPAPSAARTASQAGAGDSPGTAAEASDATSSHAGGSQDPQALQAARQDCLQKKVEEAQAAQKQRRGFGRLLGAVSRVASRGGNFELAQDVRDLYAADATVADLAAAAEDLGLTEEDVAACRNPF